MKYVKFNGNIKVYISEIHGSSLVENAAPQFSNCIALYGAKVGYYYSALGTPLHEVFNIDSPVGTVFTTENGNTVTISSHLVLNSKKCGVNIVLKNISTGKTSNINLYDPELYRLATGARTEYNKYLLRAPDVDGGDLLIWQYTQIGNLYYGLSAPVIGEIYTRPDNLISFYTDSVYFNYPGSGIYSCNAFFGNKVYGFPGETSSPGGGGGSFDSTSDNIDFPNPPTLSAVSAGFITLFSPTTSQLNDLASYMWSSAFDLDTFKKLFSDPMDAIIGVSIVPVPVPVSGSQNVKIGFVDTGVSMNVATTQYVTVDCGTLTPAEYWGSALDYSPYTKFSIHLPYIGTRELNTDDIMGKTLQVKYNIDILSGACTAMIKCGGSVLYEFSGACATAIPVTGQNWTQLVTSCIQLAGAGMAVAASGGSAAGLLPSTANAVMAMKPNIQRTGAVSGSAGMLGVQQPYLIWELPRQSLAQNYNTFVGYPSNITALLSTLSGFTQIESVHIENIPATQNELTEIETLLKEGVII